MKYKKGANFASFLTPSAMTLAEESNTEETAHAASFVKYSLNPYQVS